MTPDRSATIWWQAESRGEWSGVARSLEPAGTTTVHATTATAAHRHTSNVAADRLRDAMAAAVVRATAAAGRKQALVGPFYACCT